MDSAPDAPEGWSPYPAERASERATRLHDYWASKRPESDALPARDDIRPEEITALLPHIWLIDFDAGTRSFRYRLMGTAVADGAGRDSTGQPLAASHPSVDGTDVASRGLLWVTTHGRPLWRYGAPAFHHHADIRHVENLALPLATDHRTPDMILGLSLFYDSSGKVFFPGILRAR
jgi:hypothetical protein